MTNNTPTSTQEFAEPETLPPSAGRTASQDSTGFHAPESSWVKLLKKCLSFPAFLGALLVVSNFAIERGLSLDPDTWWHIKYGDTILQTGRWPTVDSWSFTVHGMPRIAYEWGGEVLTALAYRAGGLRGLDVLLITLTSIIVLLVYYFAWLRCRNPQAAFFATFVLLPVAVICFTLRPQLIGYIFLLITLISLERFRQGEQETLWVLPPIFLLWVNTHGSFTLGFMVLGLYWLSGLKDFSAGGLYAVRWQPKQRLHMELVGLLSVAVLPLTPYGTRLAMVPFEVASSLPLNMADINEWQPLDAGSWQAKLLLVLLFGLIVAQVAYRLRFRLEEYGLFILITYLTFVHIRFALLYAMVFAPLAASIFVRWAPVYDPRNDKHLVNAVLMLTALVAMVWFIPSQAKLETSVSKQVPVAAARYLRRHPIPGRMFNDYGYGGYLVWAMAPQRKVFIDGRGDVYEWAGVFADYMKVTQLNPDALAVLQSYRIDFCLIRPNSALATMFASRPDWKEIYKDTISAIFVRQTTKSPSPLSLSSTAEDQNQESAGMRTFPRVHGIASVN